MTHNMNMGTQAFVNRVNSMASFLQGSRGPGSGSHVDAIAAAQGNIYNMLHAQSQMLAYLDIIAVLAVFTGIMVPLVWIVPKPKGGGDAPAH
ncbi:MAG: hypothetical protein V4734_07025 [Terriglobus sp.]